MARSTSPSPRTLLARPLAPLLAALPVRAVHRAGLARCLGCALAPFETLGEAARILHLDPRRLAQALEVADGR
jgi:hypothetical protein